MNSMMDAMVVLVDSMMEPAIETTLPASLMRVAIGDSIMGAIEFIEVAEFVAPMGPIEDPPLNEHLKQDLGILHGFEIPELKELLSEQTLFNIGIDPSLPKALGPKTLWKRKVETIGTESARARVELLPTPLTYEIEESKLQDIDEFQIIEAILSLPAPDISDLFPKEKPTEAVKTSGTASDEVELQASALEDYDLACKAFSNFLYPTDATKLLIEPLKMKKRKALDCFIRLSTKASRFNIKAKMLRVARDKLSKAAREASTRADAAKKRAQDIEAVLKKSTEENSRLSGMREALIAKVELKGESEEGRATPGSDSLDRIPYLQSFLCYGLLGDRSLKASLGCFDANLIIFLGYLSCIYVDGGLLGLRLCRVGLQANTTSILMGSSSSPLACGGLMSLFYPGIDYGFVED
ncbi:hypothetical protein COCNU_scaffold006430G000020 [Cocos nucifera]|nr:hypothetical protein [Cocos nucifera]